MAQIPVYQTQARPEPLQGPYAQTPNVGQGAAALSQAFGVAADAVSKYDYLQDQSAALTTEQKITEEFLAWDAQAKQQYVGERASEYVPALQKFWADKQTEAADGLSARAKAMAGASLARKRLSSLQSAYTHQSQAVEQHNVLSFTSLNQTDLRAGMANGNFEEVTQGVRDRVSEFGAQRGWTKEMTQAQLQKTMDPYHVEWIEKLAKTDPAAAGDYFNKHRGEIDPRNQNAIATVIDQGVGINAANIAANGGVLKIGEPVKLGAGEQPIDPDGKAKKAWDYFISKGATPQQAAAIIANIHHESKFDETTPHDNGTGYGILGHRQDRRTQMEARYGKNPTFEQQLEFIWDELNGGGDAGAKRAGEMMRRPGVSAAQAAADYSSVGVRPKDVEGNRRNRAATAEAYFKKYNGGAQAVDVGTGETATASPSGVETIDTSGMTRKEKMEAFARATEGNPTAYKAGLDILEKRFAAEDRARKEGDEQFVRYFSDRLFKRLPISELDWQRLAQIDIGKVKQFQEYDLNRDKPPPRFSNNDYLDKLNEMAALEPEDFLKEDLRVYRHWLSPEDYKGFLNLQAERRKPPTEQRTDFNKKVTIALEQAGISESRDRKQYGNFRRTAEDLYYRLTDGGKKFVDQKILQEEIDRLMLSSNNYWSHSYAEALKSGKSFIPGDLTNDEKRLARARLVDRGISNPTDEQIIGETGKPYIPTISSSDRAGIISSWRRLNPNARRDPTWEEIVGIYKFVKGIPR